MKNSIIKARTVPHRFSVRITAMLLSLLTLFIVFTNEIESFHNHDLVETHSCQSHNDSRETSLDGSHEFCPFFAWNSNSPDFAIDLFQFEQILEMNETSFSIFNTNNYSSPGGIYSSRAPPSFC